MEWKRIKSKVVAVPVTGLRAKVKFAFWPVIDPTSGETFWLQYVEIYQTYFCYPDSVSTGDSGFWKTTRVVPVETVKD